MKKTYAVIGILLFLISLGFYIFIYPQLAIISGYNAKNLCSCVFVSGFDQEKAEQEDLAFGPLNIANNIVDFSEKSVESSVFGFQKKKAWFSEGAGCTLANNREDKLVSLTSKKSKPYQTKPFEWPKELLADFTSEMDYAFEESANQKKRNTRAVVIIKDGKIIAEKYAPGITDETRLLGWSMAKSITSLLAGILNRQGEFFPEDPVALEFWSDDRSKITNRHLLQMNSGLSWEEDYSKVSAATTMLFNSQSMGYFAANRPLEFEPGEVWEYSSGSSNILSFSLAGYFNTKSEYYNFPYKNLFSEIGAGSFLLETDAAGYFVGSSYCFANARDWSKIGQLCLQEGNWNGKQLIDTSWFQFIQQPAAGSDSLYGAQFWLNLDNHLPDCPKDLYYMDGFHGQRVFIIPSENMVITRLGLTYDSDDFDFNHWISSIISQARIAN